MKILTNDQTKIDIVAKLVKDGSIDFVEAIKLLEEESAIAQPFTMPYVIPQTIPYPFTPNDYQSYPTIVRDTTNPYQGRCDIFTVTYPNANIPFTLTAN